MLVGTDIMIPEQFILDLNKRTAFIRGCYFLFDLDKETPQQFVQQWVHAKTRITILPYTQTVVLLYYLDIPQS